jgi:hypothetical protein
LRIECISCTTYGGDNIQTLKFQSIDQGHTAEGVIFDDEHFDAFHMLIITFKCREK